MTKRKLDDLKDRVAALCKETDVPEPGEFLASLMAGTDPRKRYGLLYTYTKRLVKDQGPDEPPGADDWDFIRDLILDSGFYEPEPVALEQSIKAAEKLMDFLHAKLKAQEVTVNASVTHKVEAPTPDQIRKFKEIWDSQY